MEMGKLSFCLVKGWFGVCIMLCCVVEVRIICHAEYAVGLVQCKPGCHIILLGRREKCYVKTDV